MKYRHVVAFRILGITASGTDIEIPVSAEGYECILTKGPDSLLKDSDRSLAVASLLLMGLFSPDKASEGTPEERIATKAGEIRAERAKSHPSASYVVLHSQGEVAFQIPPVSRETDALVVCFDAVDKEELRERLRPQIAKAVTSLAVAFPQLVGLESARNAIDLFRDDGKQVVSLTASMGGNLVVSTGIKEADVEFAAGTASALKAETNLRRVDLHLMQSLLMREDKLRAFLSAWTALECFVNKVFRQYACRLFSDLRAGVPATTDLFLTRIIEVMEDKYRLSDKFALVVGYLSPDSCDEDHTSFKNAKKLRDSFSHGEDIEVDALPVDVVLALLRKYLALHAGVSVRNG